MYTRALSLKALASLAKLGLKLSWSSHRQLSARTRASSWPHPLQGLGTEDPRNIW